MKRLHSQIILGLLLIASSAALYFAQYAVFHESRDILFYLFQDLAFVPIQVLLVTLILDQMLSAREKQATLNKMNMVIGVFFSEVGTNLLRSFFEFDKQPDQIMQSFASGGHWSDQDFNHIKKHLKGHDYRIESRSGDLENLRDFLIGQRRFLVSLLENPILLEHESFTDLLWAVFHLTEELGYRTDVKRLPDKDYEHLSGDIKRAYVQLITEWISYMRHLRDSYPYLFSLAIRTNPFDPNASPEFK